MCVFLQKFQKLAEGLPWSKHVHSKLVCSITREIMNEHNPPMVLPNGAVYSEKAVQQVASKNHNIFTCPKTGNSVLDMAQGSLLFGGIPLASNANSAIGFMEM